MSRYAHDGNTKIVFYPKGTIDDFSAPTEAELNDQSGIDLSNMLPKDGWNPGNNTNRVDNASLAMTYDSTVPGTWGGEITAQFVYDTDPPRNIAWNLFRYGLEGEIAYRTGYPYAGDFEDGQPVQIYPIQCNQKQMNQTATNENARFTQVMNVPDEPQLDAVVGGGS